MQGFYHITEKIKEVSDADGYINVVTIGDIFEVDLNKQTIFPLLHINYVDSIIQEKTTLMNFQLICADVVDDGKEKDLRDELEPFFDVDSLQDVWNATLNYLNNIISQFRRGDAYDTLYRITGDVTVDPFKERFTNLLAGHTANVTIEVPNEAKIC